MKVECPNCGSDKLTIMTTMTVSFPFEWMRKLTKKKLRSKDFEIWGANWDRASYICKGCGYTIKIGGLMTCMRTLKLSQKSWQTLSLGSMTVISFVL